MCLHRSNFRKLFISEMLFDPLASPMMILLLGKESALNYNKSYWNGFVLFIPIIHGSIIYVYHLLLLLLVCCSMDCSWPSSSVIVLAPCSTTSRLQCKLSACRIIYLGERQTVFARSVISILLHSFYGLFRKGKSQYYGFRCPCSGSLFTKQKRRENDTYCRS